MTVGKRMRVAFLVLGLLAIALGVSDLADGVSLRGGWFAGLGAAFVSLSLTRGRAQWVIYRVMISAFFVVALASAVEARTAWRTVGAALAAALWASLLIFGWRADRGRDRPRRTSRPLA